MLLAPEIQRGGTSCSRNAAADMTNIRVKKRAGIYKSRKMASIAEMADLVCLIGSITKFGPGKFASARLMTATQIAGSLACEPAGSTKIKDDAIKKPLKTEDGFMSVSNRAGSGFKIDEKKWRKIV